MNDKRRSTVDSVISLIKVTQELFMQNKDLLDAQVRASCFQLSEKG